MFWKILAVFGVSAVPIIELKGSIPIGVAMGLDPWLTFWVAFLGSTFVSPIIMIFFRPVVDWIKRKDIKFLHKFATWAEERGYRKSASVRKYSLLGLYIFVAIPLPGTGVWMGSLIATLLELRVGHAFPIVALGNLTAALIMLGISGGIAQMAQAAAMLPF